MNNSLLRLLLAASLVSSAALAVSCGGAPETPATPNGAPSAAPTAAPSVAPSAAPVAEAVPATWSDNMTKDQQVAFMKAKVVPAMGPVFQAFDAKRYASFGCKTCHGPEFKNPPDFLPHLTLKGGNLTAFAEKPEISKFMAESVAPKMAAAMGLPPYDMKTHQGFGCGGCHAIDNK